MKENEVSNPKMQESDKQPLPEVNVHGTKVYIKYKDKSDVVPVSDAVILLRLIQNRGLDTPVLFNGKVVEPSEEINLQQSYEEKVQQEKELPEFDLNNYVNKVYSVIGVRTVLSKDSFHARKKYRIDERKRENIISENEYKPNDDSQVKKVKTEEVIEETHEYYNLKHETVKKSPKRVNEFVLENFHKKISSLFLEFRILFNGLEFLLVKFTNERGEILSYGSYKNVYYAMDSMQTSYSKIENIRFKTILYEKPENFIPYDFPDVEPRKKESTIRVFSDIFKQSVDDKIFYTTQSNYIPEKKFQKEENKPSIYKSTDQSKFTSTKPKGSINRMEIGPTRSNTVPVNQQNNSTQSMNNKATPKLSQNFVKQQNEENLTKVQINQKEEIKNDPIKHKPTNEPPRNEPVRQNEYVRNESQRKGSEYYPNRAQPQYKVREQNVYPRQSVYQPRSTNYQTRNIPNHSMNYPPNTMNRAFSVNPRGNYNYNRTPNPSFNIQEGYIIPNPNMIPNTYPNNFNPNVMNNPNINPNLMNNPINHNMNNPLNNPLNNNFNPNLYNNLNPIPNVNNNNLSNNMNNFNKNINYNPNIHPSMTNMNPPMNNMIPNDSFNVPYNNVYNQPMTYYNNYPQSNTPYVNMQYDYQMGHPINNNMAPPMMNYPPMNFQMMNNYPYPNYQNNFNPRQRRSTPNFKNPEPVGYYNNMQVYQEKEIPFRNETYIDMNEEQRKISNQQRNDNQFMNMNDLQMRNINEQQYRNINEMNMINMNDRPVNMNDTSVNMNDRPINDLGDCNYINPISPNLNPTHGKINEFNSQEKVVLNDETKNSQQNMNYNQRNDFKSKNVNYNTMETKEKSNFNEPQIYDESNKNTVYPIGSSYPTDLTKGKIEYTEPITIYPMNYYNEDDKFYKEKIKKEEKYSRRNNSNDFRKKEGNEEVKERRNKKREMKVENRLEEIITFEEIKKENELKKLMQQKNDLPKSEEDNFDPMPDVF